MKRLPLIVHTLYAELIDLCKASAEGQPPWPLSASVVKVKLNGQEHWYLQRSLRTSPGKYQQREYLGPVSDENLEKKVKEFEELKTAYNHRKELVRTLKSSGITAPTGKIGNLLLGLDEAGVLDRAMIIGTVAFQAYGPMLGARFGDAAFQTMDIDLTSAEGLTMSVANPAKLPPLLDVLKSLDPTFREVTGFDNAPPVSYINESRLRVDVLTPLIGKARGPSPTALASHGQPVRFLDYLLEKPNEVVLLVAGGIKTLVPAPARFALHKLMLSARRPEVERAKKRKDMAQAEELLGLLLEDDPDALAAAFEALAEKGPKWRKSCLEGLARINNRKIAEIAREVLAV